MVDPEIEAMAGIADALSPLTDDNARSRVLRWAAEKYGVILPRSARQEAAVQNVRTVDPEAETEDEAPEEGSGGSSPAMNGGGAHSFEHFAELFDAVQPKSEMEKALTAAFWLQECAGKSNWQSQEVNKELKDLGHYSENITRALASGTNTKPALVLQLRKTGNSRQGRKTYKLSTEGLKFIRARITKG